MMICRSNTLTSHDDVQNDHIRQHFFSIRHQKNESGPPVILDLFTLHVIDMRQGLRINQIALFH